MARKSRKGLAAQENAPQLKQSKSWRAALYIRLSVEFNGKRGDSLETQRQIMEAHLALLPDIEIARIYTDNGFTGQTFERPAFQQMLADIETGKINCVVVKDLSRLGRNAIDSGFYIEKFFPLHQVRFIAVNDNFDSEDSDNSGSHITMPIKNMLAEAYALDIGKKVKSQRLQSMRDGKFIGAIAPYGYQKDPNDCHKLVPDETTAPIVRQIFEWVADGVSLLVVTKRLNESHTLTPGRYCASLGVIRNSRHQGEGLWRSWTVRRLLLAEVYMGDMVQGKERSVAKKNIPVPPEEWVVVRDTHEPLVSRALFAKVQAILENNAQSQKERIEVPYTENILKGLVFCGHCGRKMIRKRQKGHYFYYCYANERLGRGTCPGRGQIGEPVLFQLIRSVLSQEAKIMADSQIRLQEKTPELSEKKRNANQEIARLQQKIKASQTFLTSLYESLVTGVLTTAEYRSMKADYEAEIRSLMENVQRLQQEEREREEQLTRYTDLARFMEQINEDTTLTASLISQTIERITFYSRKDVSIKFRFEDGFERVREVLHDARD